jgi:hypothetical protein
LAKFFMETRDTPHISWEIWGVSLVVLDTSIPHLPQNR